MGSRSARSIQEAEGQALYNPCVSISELQLALYSDDRCLENCVGRHFVSSAKRRGKAQCLRKHAYAATQAEMLALVWVTKQFCCYLHGRKFVARTDHAVLTYLRNFADQNRRLLRWSIKLSELDFVVEHRAGTKMAHVDALSHHVGTLVQGGTLEKNDILREEAKDAFCLRGQVPMAAKRNFLWTTVFYIDIGRMETIS